MLNLCEFARPGGLCQLNVMGTTPPGYKPLARLIGAVELRYNREVVRCRNTNTKIVLGDDWIGGLRWMWIPTLVTLGEASCLIG